MTKLTIKESKIIKIQGKIYRIYFITMTIKVISKNAET